MSLGRRELRKQRAEAPTVYTSLDRLNCRSIILYADIWRNDIEGRKLGSDSISVLLLVVDN